MVNVDKLRDASPWHPMSDPVDLKHIGKFLEELGECSAAASRCMIQGINECEPVTGKPNKDWLEDEIADVLANIELVITRFGLNTDVIHARRKRKMDYLRQWHELA